MQLYVKRTSNCEGLPLTTFTQLSSTWTGSQVLIPFGTDNQRQVLPVVGWTDLFGGSQCMVHVVRVLEPGGSEGYLVYGGNSGVRISHKSVPLEENNAHLPQGWGEPVIWVEDLADLPPDVQELVGARTLPAQEGRLEE